MKRYIIILGFLAACGGNEDGTPPAGEDVPADERQAMCETWCVSGMDPEYVEGGPDVAPACVAPTNDQYKCQDCRAMCPDGTPMGAPIWSAELHRYVGNCNGNRVGLESGTCEYTGSTNASAQTATVVEGSWTQ
jgi:hypothetical protein